MAYAGTHFRFVRFSAGLMEPSLQRFSTGVRLQPLSSNELPLQETSCSRYSTSDGLRDARRLQCHRTFRPIEPIRRYYFRHTLHGYLDALRELRHLRGSTNFPIQLGSRPKLYYHHQTQHTPTSQPHQSSTNTTPTRQPRKNRRTNTTIFRQIGPSNWRMRVARPKTPALSTFAG